MASIVGIDTGGTFTDLVAIDGNGGVQVAKYPSTPSNPMKAFVEVLQKSGTPVWDISRIVHGITVTTNTVIQRHGANVAFLATRGFEDVPFIQRINRKKEYDLQWLKPTPLVKRRNCIGVNERMSARGEVLQALDEAALTLVAEAIEHRRQEAAIDAVAICLLFSYVNPAHELRLAEHLRCKFPGLPISLSHQVAPVWREYERSSTVLADAYIKPLVAHYTSNIQDALDGRGIKAPCSILKSNGGMTLLRNAGDRPVDILLSGLAGGIVGGKFFAATAGIRDVITLDMGGTSADVGLIVGGQQRFTTDFEIEWGLPVAVPVTEVHTLGAGGGSIAWTDKGGMLNVGPQSAGAVPGPACYGTGGTEATVTDANLVLGRLNPSYFLGGEMVLDPEVAMEAVGRVAVHMGIAREEAAAAIVDIADESMTNAIRLITIEKGVDPRDFSLVAFGGAGPLHALAVARKLGISRVLIPPHPGLVSAFGAAISELRVDKVRTFAARSDQVTDAEMLERFRQIVDEARVELESEGLHSEPEETLIISLRYYQQNYEQDVEYVRGEGLTHAFARFHELHHEFYGYHFPEETIELVHLKVSLREVGTHIPLEVDGHAADAPRPYSRLVWEAGRQTPTTIYRRDGLEIGTTLRGPAIIEEVDSTTFLPSGAHGEVDHHHNLVVRVR